MPLAPDRIFTRQIALLNSLGIDYTQVPHDGIDERGVQVIGAFPELGSVTYENNSFIKTLIPWSSPEVKAKALKAREDDFAETVGMTGDEYRARKAKGPSIMLT